MPGAVKPTVAVLLLIGVCLVLALAWFNEREK